MPALVDLELIEHDAIQFEEVKRTSRVPAPGVATPHMQAASGGGDARRDVRQVKLAVNRPSRCGHMAECAGPEQADAREAQRGALGVEVGDMSISCVAALKRPSGARPWCTIRTTSGVSVSRCARNGSSGSPRSPLAT